MAAKALYATIGESQDYSLLAETGTERTVGLAVKPGSGLLERGTIVMMGADGLYAPAVTAKFTGALAAGDLVEMRRQGILVEDMDGTVNNEVTG